MSGLLPLGKTTSEGLWGHTFIPNSTSSRSKRPPCPFPGGIRSRRMTCSSPASNLTSDFPAARELVGKDANCLTRCIDHLVSLFMAETVSKDRFHNKTHLRHTKCNHRISLSMTHINAIFSAVVSRFRNSKIVRQTRLDRSSFQTTSRLQVGQKRRRLQMSRSI